MKNGIALSEWMWNCSYFKKNSIILTGYITVCNKPNNHVQGMWDYVLAGIIRDQTMIYANWIRKSCSPKTHKLSFQELAIWLRNLKTWLSWLPF